MQDTSPKLLLITNTLVSAPTGGRELLCKLNHDALKLIYGDRLVVFELPRSKRKGIKSAISTLKGHIDGLNEETTKMSLNLIQTENIGQMFVDGSNLGEIVSAVTKKFPNVETSTFFHNVEARFFWGSLRQSKTLRALAVLVANYLAERKAVRHSAKVICLSDRDSGLLYKLYGRGATHLAPMALQDKLPADYVLRPTPPKEKFALFVGGIFYANRAGISWFVKHVVPRIQIKIYIVGRGFEDLKQELEREGQVEVIGAVDSLADWYRNAYFVIAPIFDGSGMKTKVAEALMFGKKIIGTPEAFSGYEDVADRAGRICMSPKEFAAAINSAEEIVKCSFDTELRMIYESKYSLATAHLRMKDILSS